MVSAAMAVQCEGNRSNTVLPAGNGMSVNTGSQTVTASQIKEQFACGNDYSPKVRKPYTITKQRERWTEEEHKKFLEALKLYSRAWRRIEEHVGTKTAVQIRSHAQKFFSKVVREGSGSNISAVEPIEIPPPRPKRKPTHPYPRKMVHPLNKEFSVPEQLQRSSSPNFSISEQENQSPTSVLSAVGSDILCSPDSNTLSRSLSPVSCAEGSHPAGLAMSEHNLTTDDDGSHSPAPATAEAHEERSPKKVQKLELFPEENDFSEECPVKEASTQSLKLFGRTVLVSTFNRASSPVIGNHEPHIDDEKPVRPLPRNFMATETCNGECNSSYMPQGSSGILYYLQIQNENSNSVEAGSATSLPCWDFYGIIPFPCIPFPKQKPAKEHVDYNRDEIQNKQIQKEGSSTSSNSGSVNKRENVSKNMDYKTESHQVSRKIKEPYPVLELKPGLKAAASNNCMKGFVPYKKRAAESDTGSSTISGEDREEQRPRLCL